MLWFKCWFCFLRLYWPTRNFSIAFIRFTLWCAVCPYIGQTSSLLWTRFKEHISSIMNKNSTTSNYVQHISDKRQTSHNRRHNGHTTHHEGAHRNTTKNFYMYTLSKNKWLNNHHTVTTEERLTQYSHKAKKTLKNTHQPGNTIQRARTHTHACARYQQLSCKYDTQKKPKTVLHYRINLKMAYTGRNTY